MEVIIVTLITSFRQSGSFFCVCLSWEPCLFGSPSNYDELKSCIECVVEAGNKLSLLSHPDLEVVIAP